jgi:hypothetical protein
MWVMLHLYDAFSGFALKPIQLLFLVILVLSLFSSALEVRSVGVRVSRSLDFRNHHNVSPTEAEFIEQSREEKDY